MKRKFIIIPIIVIFSISLFSLPSLAFSYPPTQLDYILPGYSYYYPFQISNFDPSSYSCLRCFSCELNTGHPYYCEFYFSGRSGLSIDIRCDQSSSISYYRFFVTNNSEVSIPFTYHGYMYDGANGSLVKDSIYFCYGSNWTRTTSYTLSPGSSIDIYCFEPNTSCLQWNKVCKYSNFVVFSGSFPVISNCISFPFTVNGSPYDYVPVYGSVSGSASGSYDSSTGDVNVNVDLQQDYTPLIDTNPGVEVPEVNNDSFEDYDDVLSGLPSLSSQQINQVTSGVDVSGNGVAWVFQQIDVLTQNQKIRACSICILSMALFGFLLNKKMR